MIDLHCHLLDGIRGGADTFEASLEMCRKAAANDVRTIVATPRWAAQEFEPPLGFNECQQKLERLHEAMPEAIALRPGFLLEFRPDLAALLDRYGSAIALGGGRTVFVFLPALHVPLEADEVWSKAAEKGFSILLARAECNPALRNDSLRLERWIKRGVMLQLDAASITGMHGHEIQHFALQCVKKYEGSIVFASQTGSKGARPSSLRLAREQLLKKNPARRIRKLHETLAAMIDNAQNNPGEGGDSHTLRLSRFSRLRALRSQKVVPDES